MSEEEYKEYLESIKPDIQKEFYFFVKLILEQYYHVEGVLNPRKPDSTALILKKDKHEVAKKVAQEIQKFAKEHNLKAQDVKEILLEAISEDIKKEEAKQDEPYQPEFRYLKELLSMEEK